MLQERDIAKGSAYSCVGSWSRKQFDSRGELVRQRYARFKNHSMARLCCRQRGTVESEPRYGIDEFTFAVDEVRDPQRAIAQKDRHLAPLSQPQELTLNGAWRPVTDIHRGFSVSGLQGSPVMGLLPCSSNTAASYSFNRCLVMLMTEQMFRYWRIDVLKPVQKSAKNRTHRVYLAWPLPSTGVVHVHTGQRPGNALP